MSDVVSNFTDIDAMRASKQRVYLAPDIAEEGAPVQLNEGDDIGWNPPPAQLVMPDWSKIKPIRKYFGRTGHQVYPAWFYHPTKEKRLVANSQEAMELGIFYRDATDLERGRYGVKAVWDWKDDCEWRAHPYGAPKPDPYSTGKSYVATAPDPKIAQHALVEALIPQVAAAVAQALKGNGPSAPANIAPQDWDEFIAFQAWKKSQEAVEAVAAEAEREDEAEDAGEPNALTALTPEQERIVWAAEAERVGVKVDKRWSLDRLKTEVEKASKAA